MNALQYVKMRDLRYPSAWFKRRMNEFSGSGRLCGWRSVDGGKYSADLAIFSRCFPALASIEHDGRGAAGRAEDAPR